MIVPIKQIITENKFFDNIASGKSNVKYNTKDFQKDKNIAKFSLKTGMAGGILGGVTDGYWDGDSINDDGTIDKEATGNGMILGALAGGLGTLGYGLNNNHKVITKENLNKTKNFTKDKFTSLKNKFTK